MKFVIYRILPIIFLTVSCALFQSNIDTVSDLLPRDTDIPGWNRKLPPLEVSGRGIKQYKKEYHNIGIKTLSSCSYQPFDEKDTTITLEVFKFDSVNYSYGFFSRVAGDREFTINTINELYNSNYAVALRGEYAIYAFSDSHDEDVSDTLKNFIKITINYIANNHSNDKITDRVSILNNNGKYGIIYSIQPVEEQREIDNIFFTRWPVQVGLISVFISERETFSQSYSIFKMRVQSGFIMLESGPAYTAFRKELDGKFSFISVYENWVYGCWSIPDIETGKKTLDELRSRINPFIRH